MAQILRVKTNMTGFSGGPGVASMYFTDTEQDWDGTKAAAVAARVETFWDEICDGDILPVQISYAVETPVEVINDATGVLVTTHSHVSEGANTGGGASIGPAPVGMIIRWGTAEVVNGRTLRGRTFLVPMCLAAFQAGGTIVDAAVTEIQTQAEALIDDEDQPMVVWHRPVGGTGGTSGVVNSATAVDKAAVLRSRRD